MGFSQWITKQKTTSSHNYCSCSYNTKACSAVFIACLSNLGNFIWIFQGNCDQEWTSILNLITIFEFTPKTTTRTRVHIAQEDGSCNLKLSIGTTIHCIVLCRNKQHLESHLTIGHGSGGHKVVSSCRSICGEHNYG